MQLPPGATTPLQLLTETKKSESPLIVRLLTFRGASPVLLTVTVGVLFCVPTNTFPKLMEAGDTDATGKATPVPESDTVGAGPF